VRNRRPGASLLLLGGAVILLASIAIGQRLGDRVLNQSTSRRVPIAGANATPVAQTTNANLERNWKRLQVVSVATDPAFPDPRVTPTPIPRAPEQPTPRPTPTRSPLPPASSGYTSPPLLLPLATHAPGETQPEITGAPEPSPTP